VADSLEAAVGRAEGPRRFATGRRPSHPSCPARGRSAHRGPIRPPLGINRSLCV